MLTHFLSDDLTLHHLQKCYDEFLLLPEKRQQRILLSGISLLS